MVNYLQGPPEHYHSRRISSSNHACTVSLGSSSENTLNGVGYTFAFKHMNTHHAPKVGSLIFEILRGRRENEREEMTETSEYKVETVLPKTRISLSKI